MFTGLVETVGSVERLDRTPGGAVLQIRCGILAADLKRGESVAVDGTCLTVVRADADSFEVEISPETLRRTVLGERARGSRVNLERAVKVGDRLGGHLVQGHVDGVGTLMAIRPEGDGRRIRLLPPPGLERYLVEKGSVALDGVSLTVASLDSEGFEVSLIPHTLTETTLGKWEVSRRVNVEVDLVAKYVERLLEGWRVGAPGSAGQGAKQGWGRE
jgi:riboflavin synthase